MSGLAAPGLAIVETHPVQYHAPVYRCVQQRFGIPVTAIYGSDFSIAGGLDREFGVRFAWDTDLLSGYRACFLRRVDRGGRGSARAVSAHGLGRALAALAPAAVMLCGYASSFYAHAFLQAWRHRVPILFRAETTDHAVARNAMKRRARATVLRALYARCARLLYVGARSYQHFRDLGCSEHRLVFSPYCVDVAAFRAGETERVALREAVRRQLGVADGRTVLLFVGKLVARKGPDLLLDAVRPVAPATGDRPVVVFVGDGASREALRTRGGNGGAVDVRFVGFRNQAELSPFYHAADLLVLPSRRGETWGLVVNEALAHGVPCVVSDAVGCVPDLIRSGTTGEVFRADSVEDLRAALGRAARLIGRREIRIACRAVVAAYGIEEAAAGIAAAFQAAAAAPRVVV